MRKSSDHDGSPFEDFYDIYFNVTTDDYTESADPYISITFHDTLDDDYDYVGMARVSRRATTAYKWGDKGEMCEKRFKIYRAEIKRKEGDAEIWFRDELAPLQGILDDLDQTTRTLRSWADSGLSMRVVCTKLFCRSYNSAIIGSDQLLLDAGEGLSLDDFNQKMRCKVCGARSPILSVV